MNTVLIILGMHRSGTSLTANWMHRAGINMGDLMLEGGFGNVNGHFEDTDFLNYSEDFLKTQGNDYVVDEKLDFFFELEDYFIARAESLVDLKNSFRNQWGWKDPRTCVMLNIWQRVIPDAKYLVVYRNYAECVNSLLRRETFRKEKFLGRAEKVTNLLFNYKKKQIQQLYTEKYLKSWIFYNKSLLEAIRKKNSTDYYVIEQDAIHINDTHIEDWLIDKGFEIKRNLYKTIYQDKLKTTELEYFDAKGIDDELILEAERVTIQLQELDCSHSLK